MPFLAACRHRAWGRQRRPGHHSVCGGLSFQTRHCRSEEHTSELQSQSNLVCRLLLEKKKTYFPNIVIALASASRLHRAVLSAIGTEMRGPNPGGHRVHETGAARVRECGACSSDPRADVVAAII